MYHNNSEIHLLIFSERTKWISECQMSTSLFYYNFLQRHAGHLNSRAEGEIVRLFHIWLESERHILKLCRLCRSSGSPDERSVCVPELTTAYHPYLMQNCPSQALWLSWYWASGNCWCLTDMTNWLTSLVCNPYMAECWFYCH